MFRFRFPQHCIDWAGLRFPLVKAIARGYITDDTTSKYGALLALGRFHRKASLLSRFSEKRTNDTLPSYREEPGDGLSIGGKTKRRLDNTYPCRIGVMTRRPQLKAASKQRFSPESVRRQFSVRSRG